MRQPLWLAYGQVHSDTREDRHVGLIQVSPSGGRQLAALPHVCEESNDIGAGERGAMRGRVVSSQLLRRAHVSRASSPFLEGGLTLEAERASVFIDTLRRVDSQD